MPRKICLFILIFLLLVSVLIVDAQAGFGVGNFPTTLMNDADCVSLCHPPPLPSKQLLNLLVPARFDKAVNLRDVTFPQMFLKCFSMSVFIQQRTCLRLITYIPVNKPASELVFCPEAPLTISRGREGDGYDNCRPTFHQVLGSKW